MGSDRFFSVAQQLLFDVYRLKDGMKLQRLLVDDELDGEDVIKGFKLDVKRLFDLPNIGQPYDFN